MSRFDLSARSFPRVSSDRLAGYGAAALVVLLTCATLAALHAPVTKALPSAAGFYRIMGIKTPAPGEGLSFDSLSATAGLDAQGLPVLKIEGRIVNTGARPVPVPTLHSAVRDGKGEILARTKTPAPKPVAAPGEALPFHTILPRTTGDMRDVEVSFAAAP